MPNNVFLNILVGPQSPPRPAKKKKFLFGFQLVQSVTFVVRPSGLTQNVVRERRQKSAIVPLDKPRANRLLAWDSLCPLIG